jgi:hypothetical protein
MVAASISDTVIIIEIFIYSLSLAPAAANHLKMHQSPALALR